MKDYYAILGVSASATASEIKRAFRKLAIRYHPDKNSSPDAKTHFQEINEAYDILGDSRKRSAYDERLRNPLAGIFVEPESPPRHRDPAYRRTRPRPPQPKGPPASYLLMRSSLPYVIWISRISLVFTVLFFVDYLLPYRQVDDYIEQIYSVRRGGTGATYVILTGSGEELQVDNFNPADFGRSRDISLGVSLIFRSVMTVSNPAGTYNDRVAYMYTTLVFFPVVLFINSLLALVYRKRVEFCFNLNVTAFVLLIINLILL